MPPATRRWSKDVKLVRARAGFADIAIAAGGIWDPKQIEQMVAEHSHGAFGDVTNKFSKITWKGVVPNEATIQTVLTAFPACNIRYWLELPLFYLLDGKQNGPATQRLAFASLENFLSVELRHPPIDDDPWQEKKLRFLSGKTITSLLKGPVANQLEYLHEKDHYQHIQLRIDQALKSHGKVPDELATAKHDIAWKLHEMQEAHLLDHLQTLTLITALTKRAQDIEDPEAFVLASRAAQTLFPAAIAHYPQLLYSTKMVSELYCEQLWAPMNRMSPIVFRCIDDPDEHVERTVRSAELLGTLCVPLEHIRRGHKDEPYKSSHPS